MPPLTEGDRYLRTLRTLQRQDYLDNTDDRIADQIRSEGASKRDISGALWLVGTVAAMIALRRKTAISRTMSQMVGMAGLEAKSGLSRYFVRDIVRGKGTVRGVLSRIRYTTESIFKPIPTAQQQLNVARAVVEKYGKVAGSRIRVPRYLESSIQRHTRLHTFFRGFYAGPVAGRIPVGATGYTTAPGVHLFAGGNVYEFGEAGEIARIIRHPQLRMTSAMGAREFAGEMGIYEAATHRTYRSYIRHVVLPTKEDLIGEQRRQLLGRRIESLFRTSVNPRASYDDLVKQYMRLSSLHPGTQYPEIYQLMQQGAAELKSGYRSTLKQLYRQQSANVVNRLRYQKYLLHGRLGFGPQFAEYNRGIIQRLSRGIGNITELGALRDPVSGIAYPLRAPRYVAPGVRLGGLIGGRQAPFYLTTGVTWPRAALAEVTGTYYSTLEQLTGWGVSVRRGILSKGIGRMFPGFRRSGAEWFLRSTIERQGRLVGTLMAAYWGYRLADYGLRKAFGKGPVEAAADIYVGARIAQQEALDKLGVTKAARTIETAFPGAIKSPLTLMVKSILLPYGGLKIGRKFGGPVGARIGLSLAIAFGLITWGDITQDPDELRRIYAGEKDIPVRAGRWWMFGQTPFHGGKVRYYRPHWYPLMKSRYKFRGGMWESEEEYWEQGTPVSPVIATIKGKKWDPYYWEKKHYYDRPYLLTGELFEPTMPGAPILNPTLGRIIKPVRPMHPEYWGAAQGEPEVTSRGMVAGAGRELGMGALEREEMLPKVSPESAEWRAGQLAYTMAEQAGLRGFLVNVLAEKLTGRPDFLPEGPVVQTARRATGYERAYWERELGDPGILTTEGGITEFFRRILPHRRRAIEEFNPVRNRMPGWMPGEEYFIDFQHGDPYIKIPYGEVRLPGPAYEALHRLHSGIPKKYDAVDRFLILADVAPYSNQYWEYMYLAKAMTRDEPEWRARVEERIAQREARQKQFDFLELEPPEEVPEELRGLSRIYRRGAAALTGRGGAIAERIISPMPMVMAPVAKLFPYRTATETYRRYRVHGQEFQSWGNFYRDFIKPYANTIKGGIPVEEEERRDYEQYFDKLKYIKYRMLEDLAEQQENKKLARKFRSMQRRTVTGLNPYTERLTSLYIAIPKRERPFLERFMAAQGPERDEILDLVPDYIGNIYKAQWNIRDRRAGLTPEYEVSYAPEEDTREFFKTHYLPKANWLGWHPDVDLRDVQLKTVSNVGMNIHNFDLWESRERAMARRPYVPMIENIYRPTSQPDLNALHNVLYDELNNQQFDDINISMLRTPSFNNRLNLNVNVRKDTSSDFDDALAESVYA